MSFFQNLNVSIHFLYFWYCRITEKSMGKLRFSKNCSRASLHSRFRVLLLWTRKLPFLKRKHQIHEFRKKQLALNSETNLLISRHLVLITHDATTNVNSSIQLWLSWVWWLSTFNKTEYNLDVNRSKVIVGEPLNIFLTRILTSFLK